MAFIDQVIQICFLHKSVFLVVRVIRLHPDFASVLSYRWSYFSLPGLLLHGCVLKPVNSIGVGIAKVQVKAVHQEIFFLIAVTKNISIGITFCLLYVVFNALYFFFRKKDNRFKFYLIKPPSF